MRRLSRGPRAASVVAATALLVGAGLVAPDLALAAGNPAPAVFTSTPPFPAVVGGTYAVTASGGTAAVPVTFSLTAPSAASCHLDGAATVVFDAKGTCTIVAKRRANQGNPTSTAKQTVRIATRNPIEHVVLFFQENHSFDETLGVYCQTRAVPCDGYTGPVTLADGTTAPQTHSPDVVPIVDHSVAGQQAAQNGGRMDGWASLRGCEAPTYNCLSYYTPADIPNLTALADHYAVSDRTFSFADSSSFGGHLYAATADLDGFTGDIPKKAPGVPIGPGWGCDSNRITDWTGPDGVEIQVPSCVPNSDGSGPFRASPVPHIDTVFDQLQEVGKSWRIYGAPSQDPDNPHGGGGYGWSICPTFADCLYSPQRANLVNSTQILADAANGTLPSYSVITPSGASANLVGTDTSQHNQASMAAGDDWIGRVLTALQSSPQWGSTAVFITYDDCGCFYDHVPPPLNPDGTRGGVRLPMVVASPWVRAGYDDSTPTSLAGVLAFAEHVLGVEPMNVNDAQAYPYAGMFNFSQRPLTTIPMTHPPIPPASVAYAAAHPTDDDPS